MESQLEAKNEEYKKTHTKIRESTNKKERLSIGETQQRSRSETFIEKKSSLPEKENLNSMNEGPKHSPLNKVDSYCSTPLQQAFLSQSLKFIDSPSENDQKMSEENENLLKVHRNSNLYLSSNKSNPKNRRDTKKFIVNIGWSKKYLLKIKTKSGARITKFLLCNIRIFCYQLCTA